MSDIEGRGLQSLAHEGSGPPRLRRPPHHDNVRMGIATRRAWITFAGVLLLLSAAIGFYTSAQLFYQASSAQQPEAPGEAVEVGGVVTDMQGDVLQGVSVEILDTGNVSVTNADGRYFLGDIPVGSYTIEASFPGYTTVAKPIVLEGGFPRLIDFALEPGNDRVVMEPEREPNFQNPAAGAFALAVAVLFASGMAAAGGISAIRHRNYLIAVTGAAAGVLTLGYFIGSIAAIAALAILASLRHGFREAEFHHLPWEEEPEGYVEGEEGAGGSGGGAGGPEGEPATSGEEHAHRPPPPGALAHEAPPRAAPGAPGDPGGDEGEDHGDANAGGEGEE